MRSCEIATHMLNCYTSINKKTEVTKVRGFGTVFLIRDWDVLYSFILFTVLQFLSILNGKKKSYKRH